MGSKHFDSAGVRHIAGETTFGGSLARQLRDEIARTSKISYPATQFQQRGPNGETGIEWFAREVLGIRAWSKTREMFEAAWDAIKPDSNRKRIVVKSSQKSSKTHTVCVITLYLLYCFEDPYQVLFIGPSEKTVKVIMWGQLKELIRSSGTCLSCREAKLKCPHANPLPIEGHAFPKDPTTGLFTGCGNNASVYGFTVATDKERIAGFSGFGGRLVIIGDEASGVTDPGIYATVNGNLAGSEYGFEWWQSNPTKTKGPYYQYCTDKRYQDGQHFIHINAYHALKDPEAQLIPGLARKAWVEKTVREGGGLQADEVRIRVLGEFPKQDGEGGYFTPQIIEDSIARWTDKPTGKVVIGVDPAGPGDDADDTAFCVLVGDTVAHLECKNEMTSDKIFDEVLKLAEKYSKGATWWLTWDGGGDIGFKLTETIRARAGSHPQMQWKRGKNNSSDAALYNDAVYDRIRDEMAGRVRERMIDSLALPQGCAELTEELLAISLGQNRNGKLKMTPKPKLLKALHRSPDRYSALAVACYLDPRDPVTVLTGSAREMTPAESMRASVEQSRSQLKDPRKNLGRKW